VASRVLPGGVRRHLLALYGFFRLVDYAGDEAPGHRDSLLDLLDADLKRVYHGAPRVPLLRALVPTVRTCAIPREILARLIDANRQDQRVSRYEKFDDLCDYCALSANPVGQSVLHVFGRAEPSLIELSDQVCTALQILEHCQDVGKDYEQGRIYLPAEDLRRFHCTEEDLRLPSAPTTLRGLIRFEVNRALAMLDSGSALVGRLSGVARVAVAGYVAGGRATARAFAAAGHDPLATEVRPGRGWTTVEWVRLWATGGIR
jgi:squalene synthase HpnC